MVVVVVDGWDEIVVVAVVVVVGFPVFIRSMSGGIVGRKLKDG